MLDIFSFYVSGTELYIFRIKPFILYPISALSQTPTPNYNAIFVLPSPTPLTSPPMMHTASWMQKQTGWRSKDVRPSCSFAFTASMQKKSPRWWNTTAPQPHYRTHLSKRSKESNWSSRKTPRNPIWRRRMVKAKAKVVLRRLKLCLLNICWLCCRVRGGRILEWLWARRFVTFLRIPGWGAWNVFLILSLFISSSISGNSLLSMESSLRPSWTKARAYDTHEK